MKTHARTRCCLAILSFACGTLLAQDTHRSPQMSVAKASLIVREADAAPAALKKLFSNLGSKTHAYDDINGLLVEGPTNPATHQYQWIANPFIPKTNATVKKIEIALTYQGSGANNAVVALCSDRNGLPGRTLEHWNVTHLPPVGECCKLVEVTSKKGVKVKRGTQYWVVGRTNQESTSAYDAWEFVWNFKIGPIAFISTDTNNAWTLYSDGTENAFAIFGTTP